MSWHDYQVKRCGIDPNASAPTLARSPQAKGSAIVSLLKASLTWPGQRRLIENDTKGGSRLSDFYVSPTPHGTLLLNCPRRQ
jgi:hypothetical protein